jgi:hypothetical protein
MAANIYFLSPSFLLTVILLLTLLKLVELSEQSIGVSTGLKLVENLSLIGGTVFT